MTLDLAHITLITLSITLFLALQLERHRAIKREEKYVRALLSENVVEYQNTPENQMKSAKTESKLAESAYKLEQHINNQDGPNYPVS
jgi:hypothetical protein